MAKSTRYEFKKDDPIFSEGSQTFVPVSRLPVSDKGHYVPGNPLEKMAEQLLTELRGFGPTAEEREASGGEELTASVPQGKRPKSRSATSQATDSVEFMEGEDMNPPVNG